MRQRLLHGLQWLKDRYAAQGWAFVAEPEDIVDEVMEGASLLEVGPCIIGFSLVQPWFLTELVLTEEFIMYEGDLPEIVKALEEVGRRCGAKRLTVGTRAVAQGKHAALARLYSRQGLSVSTLELTKEIV
jgi:hypothetical protein